MRVSPWISACTSLISQHNSIIISLIYEGSAGTALYTRPQAVCLAYRFILPLWSSYGSINVCNCVCQAQLQLSSYDNWPMDGGHKPVWTQPLLKTVDRFSYQKIIKYIFLNSGQKYQSRERSVHKKWWIKVNSLSITNGSLLLHRPMKQCQRLKSLTAMKANRSCRLPAAFDQENAFPDS